MDFAGWGVAELQEIDIQAGGILIYVDSDTAFHERGFWLLKLSPASSNDIQYVNNNKIMNPEKNGKETHKWGVAEIQKMSPSTTGKCK